MVDQVGGNAPITPHDKEVYKQDFNRAVDLFQQSLVAYEKSQSAPQKAKFKDVMDKCLNVIHETIKEAIRVEAQKQLKTVEKDYQNFIDNDNPTTYQQLNKDLDSLKIS